jgi:hypothetical protein
MLHLKVVDFRSRMLAFRGACGELCAFRSLAPCAPINFINEEKEENKLGANNFL